MKTSDREPVCLSSLNPAGLRHYAGLALWQLARVLVLSLDPGAWSSTVPVLPYTLCLRDAQDRVYGVLRYREAGFGNRPVGTVAARRRRRRCLAWLRRGLPYRYSFIGARDRRLLRRATRAIGGRLRRLLDAIPDPIDPDAQCEEALRVLVRLEQMGPGSPDDRLVYGRYLTSAAVRLMRKPSLEHAMALRLLSHIGDVLGLEEVWSQVLEEFVRTEQRYRSRVAAEEADRWHHIYLSRRHFAEGDKRISEYRIRANGVIAEIKAKENYAGNLSGAAESFKACIAECRLLMDRYPLDYPRHVEDQARVRLWLVAVCLGSWDAALEAWRNLWAHAPEFCQRELPALREFPILAPEFVRLDRTRGSEAVQQVSALLQKAEAKLSTFQRKRTSAGEAMPIRYAVEAVEAALGRR